MYIQFAFRWMNCLLMRELPQRAVVRAWDTYLAEENGFESFHVYVSAALLCHFSGTLREMDFQTMASFFFLHFLSFFLLLYMCTSACPDTVYIVEKYVDLPRYGKWASLAQRRCDVIRLGVQVGELALILGS